MKRMNEEVGTSSADKVKYIVFAELGSLIGNKAGSLILMFPELGASPILSWSKFTHKKPIYSDKAEQFSAITARFSGNNVLNSMYSTINRLKSKESVSADENAKREQEIARLLGRAGTFIKSKLTEPEQQLFIQVNADLKPISLSVVDAINDALVASTAQDTAEEEPEETPEETPKEEPKTEPTEEPTEEPEEEPAEEPTETPTEEPKAEPKAEKPKSEPKAEPKAEKPKTEPKAEPKAEKPKAEPKEEPAEKPKEESVRKMKAMIREMVLSELRNLNEAFDDMESWRDFAKPYKLNGKESGFILNNGIIIDTTNQLIIVDNLPMIKKVYELISKKVFQPKNYIKAKSKLIFTYDIKDEMEIGAVLSDIN